MFGMVVAKAGVSTTFGAREFFSMFKCLAFTAVAVDPDLPAPASALLPAIDLRGSASRDRR
jgi:hypothetical protein